MRAFRQWFRSRACAANRFGAIGAFVDRKDNDGGYKRIDENARVRQAVENNKELNQKRRAAGHPDVEAGNVLEHGNAGILNECHNDGND